MSNSTTPKPRIPAAIRDLGARTPQRTGPRSFSLAFAIDGSVDSDAPGHGTAIVDALRAKFGAAVIHWNGSQADSIFIIFA